MGIVCLSGIWKRWEQEIDWMALHGINMPLTLVAHETIMARVYKKFGLSDEEINSYFVGPATSSFLKNGTDGEIRWTSEF